MRWTRLRWRLRGAWLWPTFAGLTLLDAWLLHVRPVQGQEIDLVPAFLLAGFANLGAVALLAPLAALALRRAVGDLPRFVAADYAGTALVVSVTLVLLAAGLVHHRAVVREERASARAVALMRDWAAHRAPLPARRNLAAAETIRVDPGRLYRSCLPTPDPRRPYCVLVHLDTSPPRVVYGGREPNAAWEARGG